MLDQLIVNMNGTKINNEEELAAFVSHESQVKGEFALPQWRLFLKSNYGEDKSLFILKMHHVMTDGYGIAVFLGNVCDSQDEELLPHLPSITTFQRVMMFLSLPYHWLKMAITFIPYPSDNNPFTWKTPHNSGVKRGFFAKEYSVSAIK